ncbi:SubName: Full=Uncharacterized protein {ECO:0000313/EMBL:CCA67076.1} [Serendipita indica DSM 11827]|nr:SubName: Full=Uncharacterized protein {ECO:0000313/EMBL:CCA67076.1} [Serendipita indica DSM 11827]
MPKVKSLRAKAAKHQPAAKSSKVAENEANDEIVDEGPSFAPGALSKKEKRLIKREAFLERKADIAESQEQSVHSKSAQRRAKRREKERLAADMSEMDSVLRTVILDATSSQDIEPTSSFTTEPSNSIAKRRKGTTEANGQIGESTRAKPLTKAQKKRALHTEKQRLPLILSHPAFLKDSFGTIRTHTSNVLAKATST